MNHVEKFDIKETIINNKSKYIEEFKIEFSKFVNKVKEFSPYEMLSHLNVFYKMTLVNIEKDYGVESESIVLKYTIELLQMIISCIPAEEFKNKSMKDEDMFLIQNMGSNLFRLKTQYIVSCTYEMDNENSEIAQYILESEISSEITGKRYDIFEIIHYRELFTPLKYYFEKTYKFPLEQLFRGIYNIKQKFTFGYNKSRENMTKIIDKLNGKEPSEREKEEINCLFDEMFGLKLQNVSNITGWPTQFLDVLSYRIGENLTSIDNISFEKLYDLHKEINRKPLLNINDDYYYFCIHRLTDNLDRIILKDLYQKNKTEIEIIKKIVADTCENLVGDYIKKIIPNASISTSNYYKIGKDFCENDILITFDKYLFVIEVKSGSFTPDVALNNMQSHRITLNKLVEEADSQVNRFITELEIRKKIDIYDSNNKSSKLKKTINLEDYKQIFKLAITLEGFNEIGARADKVGILNINKEIIVCSLDDLKVYSDYFENNPTQFLHYITYRKMATNSREIELNDELDHLGLYIDYNCYPMTAQKIVDGKKGINHIIWESPREKLDLYYNSKYIGGTNRVSKPIQKIPSRLREIIDFVNNNLCFNNICSIGYLLDLSGEQKEKLFDNIEMFIKYNINTSKIKYICVQNNKELVLLSCVVNNKDLDKSTLFDGAYANLKIYNAKEAYIIFLHYDIDKKLKDITLDIVRVSDDRYLSEEVEVLEQEIVKRRFLSKKNRIGRNEQCPCGSGLKYKKCCGK